jgi:hypothetical protein
VGAEARKTSELWFERYCESHEIDIRGHEPDLGVSKRPDYLVARERQEVVCEVKEFTTSRFDELLKRGGGFFSLSEREELKPVRTQVREAARQLKPLEGSDWPLVVVLANPQSMHVPLEPDRLINALYGDLTIAIDVSPEGAKGESRWGAGRHGRLRNDHPYISAVVALRQGDLEDDWWRDWHERYGPASAKTQEEALERARARSAAAARAREEEDIPQGEYYRVDVIKTWSDTAKALPDDFFAGPRDTLWCYDGAGSAFVRVR